jgi:hypothetical protein
MEGRKPMFSALTGQQMHPYRQAGQSLILFHFQQSFGLPNPPPFIPHFHTFPASMDQFLHLDSHNKPTTHPQKHHQPSNSELLASAKLLAEAAQSSMRHETDKVNKGRPSVPLPISRKHFFFFFFFFLHKKFN